MTTNNTEIPPRWYFVSKDGAAVLCVDEQDARDGAEVADQAWPNNAPHAAVQLAPVQPAMPADADMFWDANNPEVNQDSIHNTVVEVSQNRMLHVGDIVEIQRAISLPNISVRITSIEDDGESELDWEIIDARRRIEGESHD